MSVPDHPVVLYVRLFLAFGLWATTGYLASTLLFEGVAGLADEPLPLLVVAGCVAALGSAVVGTWQWHTYGTARTHVRRTVVVDAPVAEVLRRVADARRAAGTRDPRVDEQAGTVALRTPSMLGTFGQVTRVEAVADGAGSRVTVSSRPAYPLTLTDSGRNAAQVERLLAVLEPVSA